MLRFDGRLTVIHSPSYRVKNLTIDRCAYYSAVAKKVHRCTVHTIFCSCWYTSLPTTSSTARIQRGVSYFPDSIRRWYRHPETNPTQLSGSNCICISIQTRWKHVRCVRLLQLLTV